MNGPLQSTDPPIEPAEAASPAVSGMWPLLVLVGALLIPLQMMLSQTSRGDHSSNDLGPDGTAALAGVLERLDLPVESLSVGLLPLRFEEPGSVLIMPLPEESPAFSPKLSGPEAEMLERFVGAGSTLILVTSRHGSATERLGFDLVETGRQKKAVREQDPLGELASPTFVRAQSLAGGLRFEGEAWLEAGPEDDVLFGQDGFPVVAQRSLDKGRILLVTDPSTISNRGLSRGANLEFYVGFIQRWLGPEGRVLFDDVHAGGGAERGVVTYARRAGLLPTLLLIALLLLLYVWRGAARFGVIQASSSLFAGRASSERVVATAGLYERAGLYHYGLTVSSRRFRRLLERRSGKVWEQRELRSWVEREWGPEAVAHFDRVRTQVRRLLGQERPAPKACLSVVRLINDFEDLYVRKWG
jgi:hypothetical protein